MNREQLETNKSDHRKYENGQFRKGKFRKD